MNISCEFCSETFPGHRPHCPHCGQPSLFPNVTAANAPAERDALENRYRLASEHSHYSGTDDVRTAFEQMIESSAQAIISMSMNDLERLAKSDENVFSTYYQRVQAGLQIPRGNKWDVLRGVAEHALFPGYKEQIRFGALSIDGTGVRNYGECSVQIKIQMIGHRTTLFEDNNVIFTIYERQASMASAESLEAGFRATWRDRAKLCVAKLAKRLQAGLTKPDFANLVLEQGATTSDDRFIELHIWGSLTVRSIERVRVHRRRNRPLMAVIRDLQMVLDRHGIELEHVTWKP